MLQKQMRKKGMVTVALAVMLCNLAAPLASAASSTSATPSTPATGTAAAAPATTTNPNGAFNFNVSPPSVAVEARPGTPVTVDIRVQNQGIATENVKATLMKFTAEGETGLPNLRKLETTDEFGKWAVISPATFSAEPNVWKTVKLTISPPKDAAFGYYYAVVFSRADSAKQTQSGKANLLGAFASLVLLDVKAPGAVRKVEVAEFSTTSNSTEFLPVTFNVRMHNTGNTHVGVSGNITLSKGGKLVAQIDVNSSKGYILPRSFRNFTTKWQDGTPSYMVKKDASGKPILDPSGTPEQSLVWDKFSPSKLRFGKYNARLVMVYNDGQGDVSTEARLSFWVLPWRIVAALIAVGLLILAGIWALIGRPLSGRFKRNKRYEGRRQ